MPEEMEANGGWAGPAMFTVVAVAILIFFIWFL